MTARCLFSLCRVLPGIALALGVTGCGFIIGEDVDAVCAVQAREWGPDFEVAGAFRTTIGAIRDLTPHAEATEWPNLPRGTPAALCYLDGGVDKAPPGGDRFDRAMVGVADGEMLFLAAGYQDRMAVEAP